METARAKEKLVETQGWCLRGKRESETRRQGEGEKEAEREGEKKAGGRERKRECYSEWQRVPGVCFDIHHSDGLEKEG